MFKKLIETNYLLAKIEHEGVGLFYLICCMFTLLGTLFFFICLAAKSWWGLFVSSLAIALPQVLIVTIAKILKEKSK